MKPMNLLRRLAVLELSICSTIAFGAPTSDSVVGEIIDVDQLDLNGAIGEHPIVVHLLRTGEKLNGYYQYAKQVSSGAVGPQKAAFPTSLSAPLWLSGHLEEQGKRVVLVETRDQATPTQGAQGNVTGLWSALLEDGTLKGGWSHGGQTLQIAAKQDVSVPAFQYQMKVRVRTPGGFSRLDDRNHDLECESSQGSSGNTYAVDEIYFYRDGKLAQTLDGFKATGVCAPSFPRIRDVQFNGNPAIVLAMSPGVSGQHYYLLWTYDAVRERFVVNTEWSALFTGWDDPIVDVNKQELGVCWESSGSWPFGSRSYRWNGTKLLEIGRNDCGDSNGGQKCTHFGDGPDYRSLCQRSADASGPLAW
jgi:hypothetical protein